MKLLRPKRKITLSPRKLVPQVAPGIVADRVSYEPVVEKGVIQRGEQGEVIYATCTYGHPIVGREGYKYRYVLEYRFSGLRSRLKPMLYVCMLNPSTAGHSFLDPTVKGLLIRAERLGYGGITIVNMYAQRCTNPKDLGPTFGDMWGNNIEHVEGVLSQAYIDNADVLCGWGAYKNLDPHVLQLLGREGLNLRCFAVNKDGSPKHPLYVKHDAELLWYEFPDKYHERMEESIYPLYTLR